MSTWKTMIMLGTILVCSGCASQAPVSAGCGDTSARRITINYKKNETIRVSPPTREVEQGEAIEFRLKGEAGTMVTVSGKGSTAQWISGSDAGSPGGTSFYVCVGTNQAPVDYGYKIEVAGVGYLDPVVRVKTKGLGR